MQQSSINLKFCNSKLSKIFLFNFPFQVFSGISERTVLLTGLEELQMTDIELLEDLVNIHFQREINGGGEVEVVKCSLGQPCIAYFEEERNGMI